MGVALLLLSVLLLVLPAALGPGRADESTGPVTWPDRISYSHLTGWVEDAPLGRAAMVFSHGYGVEFLDFPQAGVLGVDGDAHRRVRTAERRSTGTDQGDPAPMLLSPDGRQVAVGSYGSEGSVAIVDLATGEVGVHDIEGAVATEPGAWAHDGRTLWVRVRDQPFDRYMDLYQDSGPEQRTGWSWHRVDLATGGTTAMPDSGAVRVVAPLPDGSGVLVQERSHQAQLRSADGLELLDADVPVQGRLLPWSVSPDGTRLAVTSRTAVTVAPWSPPADGAATAAATAAEDETLPLPEWGAVLGWIDDSSLLVSDVQSNESDTTTFLHRLDLGSGGLEQLTASDPGWTGAAVDGMTVASDLLDGMTTNDSGVQDRAALTLLRIPVAVTGALVGGWLLALALARHFRSRSRAVPAGSS